MAIADVLMTSELENPMMVYIGIHADLKGLRTTAKRTAALSFIGFAATMLGHYEIVAISIVGSTDELLSRVSDDILSIPGVHRVETTVAIKNLMHDYRWARIVS